MSAPVVMPRLVTVEAACAYLGDISTMEQVPVRPVRIGRRVLYDLRALDAWLDSLSGLGQGSAPQQGARTDAGEDDPAEAALRAWTEQGGGSFGVTHEARRRA